MLDMDQSSDEEDLTGKAFVALVDLVVGHQSRDLLRNRCATLASL